MTGVLHAHGPGTPGTVGMSAEEFAWVTRFLQQHTGIELKDGKQALVTSRLDRRLRHHGLASYRDYFELVGAGQLPGEAQVAIDLLTTNETSFFREPTHFEFLAELAARRASDATPFRVWSAACSTGEEAWSIAMVMAEHLGARPWEVIGTDISSRVLETAREGVYPIAAAGQVPPRLLRHHCLRGKGPRQGTFAVGAALRSRTSFTRLNLCAPLPEMGRFDAVFLRNVMIYFGPEVKRQVVERVVGALRPGGAFVIGHAEPLTDRPAGLVQLRPSVFRLEAA